MTPTDAADPIPSDPALGAAVLSGSRAAGLTAAEAAARLSEDGPNAIGGGGRRTLAAILVAQVASPLVLILVAASLVSLVVGDAVTPAIILAIVAMSAALGFVQEARSETAVAALQARLTLRATVVRDGAPHGRARSTTSSAATSSCSARATSCRPTAASSRPTTSTSTRRR